MARRLILDAEAVEVLAHPNARGLARERSASIYTFVQRTRSRLIVPLVVLAEIYRGSRVDAEVDHTLNRERIPTPGVDRKLVRVVGQLRARAQTGSVVDATLVATAIRLGGGVIATGDPDDLRALACEHKNVKVWSLNDPPPRH